MSFEFQDLYALGLGFDFVGALLLAFGLVANNLAELNRIAGSFYGSNPYQAVSAARDRINAISGVVLLLLGFVVEATAYLLQLGRPRPLRSGHDELIAGAFLMAVALVLGWLAGRLHLRVRLKRTVVKMTRYRLDGSLMSYPHATLMVGRAKALGYEQDENESDLDFVRRTLGVKDLVVADTGRERLASEPAIEVSR